MEESVENNIASGLEKEKNDTPNVPNNFKCDICQKVYETDNELKDHNSKSHTVEDNQKKYLECKQVHVETVHEGRRKYECQICGDSFVQLVRLNTHIEIVHQGKKDHKCEICNKSFGRSDYLKGKFFEEC